MSHLKWTNCGSLTYRQEERETLYKVFQETFCYRLLLVFKYRMHEIGNDAFFSTAHRN